MSFTYDLTTALGQVRYLIGDTLSTDPTANADDEITFCLTQNNNDIYRAGAFACRRWAAKLNQELSVDQGQRGWKLDRQAQIEKLFKLALQLESEATTLSGIAPYAGGISVSDKQTREQDTDRVQPGTSVATHRTPGLPNGGGSTDEARQPFGWWY